MMSSSAHSWSSSRAIFRFSASAQLRAVEHVRLWKSRPPAGGDALAGGLQQRAQEVLDLVRPWQWSVWRATSGVSYFSATRWTNSASAMAPKAASFTAVPEANSPPPVVTWMMPSVLASLKARQRAVHRARAR